MPKVAKQRLIVVALDAHPRAAAPYSRCQAGAALPAGFGKMTTHPVASCFALQTV
jgi:hypothetical protein